MRKLFYLIALTCAMVFTACSSNLDVEGTEPQDSVRYVTMSFEPQYEITPMTRAAISPTCNKLVVKVVEENGASNVYTQSSSDTGFGTMKIGINSTTSKVYSIAYWGNNTVSIANDGVTAFENNKIVDAFFATTSEWKLYEKSTVSVSMDRVAAKIQLNFTEAEVPSELSKMVLTVTGGTNIINSTETAQIVNEFADVSTGKFGTKTYPVLLYIPTGTTKVSVKATAYNSSNKVIQERTFTDVPIQANYITSITGKFFYDGTPEFTFTINDTWNTGDTINY